MRVGAGAGNATNSVFKILFSSQMAHVYFNKFPITCMFLILYEFENTEPA